MHVCVHKHTLGNFVYFYTWAEIINLSILAVFQHICWTNCHITNLKIWGSHCCFKIILLNATNPKLNIQYMLSPEKDRDNTVSFRPLCLRSFYTDTASWFSCYAPHSLYHCVCSQTPKERKDAAATQPAEKQSTNSRQNAKNY